MKPTGIKPGTRIIITVKSKNQNAEDLRVPSIFEADGENGEFIIYAPLQNGKIFPLHPEENIMIDYAADELKYIFSATVVERFEQERLPFVRLCRTGEITAIQRRKDFRVPYVRPFKVCCKRQEENKADKEILFTAHGVDLSGGGVSFYHNQSLYPDDRLTVMLIIDKTEMNINSKITYIRRLEDNIKYKYCTGVQFQHDRPSDKEIIVRYIFKIQRENLRRAVL